MKKITLLITTLFLSSFSWAQISFYNFSETTGNTFSSISATGTSIALTDDSKQLVNVGFTFHYNGADYTEVSVSSNGYLRMGDVDSANAFNILAGTGIYLNLVSAFWDDLNPDDGGNIYYETQGTAPNRTFILEYNAIPRYDVGGGVVTDQVVLYETTNNIEYKYGASVTGFDSASIGFTMDPGNTNNFISVTPGTPATTSTTVPDDALVVPPADGTNYLFTYNPPVCSPPTALAATNVANTTVDLSWNDSNGGTSTYLVEWREVGAGAWSSFTTATGVTTYQITGLTGSTEHEWQITADCAANGLSTVVYGSNFTTLTPPPANDDFANATPVTCNGNYVGSTTFATLDEDDAPDQANPTVDLDGKNVWFSYTGSGTQEEITVDLCLSNYDTSFLVYTGTSGNLTLIAANDDAGSGGSCGANTLRSFGTFISDGTTTYYITVEGWNFSSSGDYDMTITCAPFITPPTNDDCATPTALTLGASVTGDTAGATQDASQANPTCESIFVSIADVWYTFVAPASGDVNVVTTLISANQANVAVYDDCLLTTTLGCTDANGGETLNVTGLTNGVTYYVRVWNDGAATRGVLLEGTFDIIVSEGLVSVNDLQAVGFNYYPNPVSNNLTMTANENINNIAVFNMLGQEVLNSNPSALEANIDMSNLSTGTYFVKAQVGNNVGTFKIVKN
jgi:hypothetical protein